jgi:hypothetical protein
MLFCLVGVLIGWLIALTVPTPYRATKELYVGLNIYQANQDSNAADFAGIQFYNADDYKNWQMANLNSLVYIDPIIDQTLYALQETDPYWQSINRHELTKMLHVYWRNAGKWRLVAEHPQAERAQQAVLLWEAAVIEQVALSIEQSRQVMTLHIQMQALADQQAQIALQQSSSLDGQAVALQQSYAQLSDQYALASKQSLGLSPNLKVDPITEEPPQITRVRPVGLLLLVGASLGAIAWLLFNLVRISQKVKR